MIYCKLGQKIALQIWEFVYALLSPRFPSAEPIHFRVSVVSVCWGIFLISWLLWLKANKINLIQLLLMVPVSSCPDRKFVIPRCYIYFRCKPSMPSLFEILYVKYVALPRMRKERWSCSRFPKTNVR